MGSDEERSIGSAVGVAGWGREVNLLLGGREGKVKGFWTGDLVSVGDLFGTALG